MSANLEDKYVFSMKPSPTPLSMPKLDLDAVRDDLHQAMEMTRDNVVEVIMKDNHTLGRRPENAVEWSRIAKQEARRVSGNR